MSLQIQLKKSAVSQKQPFASDLAVGELALNYNADGPFLTCKDSAGNVRKLNHVWVGATAPTSPSAGDQWLDTSAATAVLKVYKDSSSTWVNATTIPIATTSVYGTVRLATAADVTNGTSGKIVDAAQLQSKITSAFAQEEITLNDVNLLGDMVIAGDLTVNGTTTTIDTETLIVEDKNIEMGSVDTPTDTTADGGGITLKGTTDKTINWVNATDAWTSSERFDLPAGTAAAPSLIFNGDVNSGVYSPGADQLAISTNGTGRLFVDANGNVGVGVAPTRNFFLYSNTAATFSSIVSSTTGTAALLLGDTDADSRGQIRYENSTDHLQINVAGSERLRITSDGKLGLGTSSPGTTAGGLDIASGGIGLVIGADPIATTRTNATNKNARIANYHYTNTEEPFTIINSVSTAASNVLYFGGGSSILNCATQIAFYTAANATTTTGTSRMVIDSSGRVGIGTTTPGENLSVWGEASSAGVIGINGNSGQVSRLQFKRVNTNRFKIECSATDDLIFYSDASTAERLRITSDGKLGLGTSTPGSAIDVQTSAGAIANFSSTNADGGYVTVGRAGATSIYGNYRSASGGGTQINADALFFRSANGIGFGPAGAGVGAFLDTSGRLGIGTTSPGYLLDVRRSSAGDVVAFTGSTDGQRPLRFVSADNGIYLGAQWTREISSGGGIHAWAINNSERARIDSSGRLLVGTSTARQTGGGFTAQSQIEGAGTVSASSLTITSNRISDDLGPRLNFARSKGGAIGSNTIVDADAEYGGIYFFGADGSDTDSIGAQISAYVDGTPGANDMPGRLVFSTTADGASSPTERMRIDSSGRVGIGTTSPSQILSIGASTGRIFTVNQGTTNKTILDNDYALELRSNGGYQLIHNANNSLGSIAFLINSSERARIDSSGRLLVGTSSGTDLDGVANASFVTAATGTRGGIAITHYDTSASSDPVLALRRSGSSTIGTYAAIGANRRHGTIGFYGTNGTGFAEGAQIRAEAEDTWAVGDNPSRLVFSTTADGAASPTERMRIDSQGRVGIGTTSPSELLHVSGGNQNIRLSGSYAVSQSNKIEINNGQTGAARYAVGLELSSSASGGYTSAVYNSAGSDTRYAFISATPTTTSFLTANTERARIDNSGRLLVGTTTSPSAGGQAQYAKCVVAGNTSSSTTQGILNITRGQAASGTIGADTEVGHINFTDSVGNEFARITCATDGAVSSASDLPGRLVFSTTADGASSPTERMRIKSDGTINFSNVAVYADNAAAKTGGLVDGDVYRTSTGDLKIVYT